jgi:hypothetical protein
LSKPLKIQIIGLARTLIADEQHWCTHNLAQDKDGVVVSPISPQAVKRCAMGAVIEAAYQLTHDLDAAHKLRDDVFSPIVHPAALMNVNDTKGHSAVLAVFDEIIAAG